MTAAHPPAPEIEAERWFNAPRPLPLAALRGKVVVLHAFQMLCPGCVLHAIPQAKRLFEIAPPDLAVLGLHTVFEHHDVMGPDALAVFLSEYRVQFPVAVDRPGANGPIPATMAAYAMRGTPSTVVIDRQGRIARHSFGAEDDLALGLFLGRLLGEAGGSGDA